LWQNDEVAQWTSVVYSQYALKDITYGYTVTDGRNGVKRTCCKRPENTRTVACGRLTIQVKVKCAPGGLAGCWSPSLRLYAWPLRSHTYSYSPFTTGGYHCTAHSADIKLYCLVTDDLLIASSTSQQFTLTLYTGVYLRLYRISSCSCMVCDG